ncbi:hypothetical protein H0H87_004318 [Tephrocybe sp. NHM501043]|nr:hypothetical protein H0H87_004318 [Tephrocybe sp. NHM501043]
MNNPYGSPYQHYASQPSPAPPAQPPPHQYPYPMHYYPPAPYQYPPHMMMYPSAPRPSAPAAPQNPPDISHTQAPPKRKRKSTDTRKGDRSDDDATSGSDNRIQQQHTQSLVDLKKRTKTSLLHSNAPAIHVAAGKFAATFSLTPQVPFPLSPSPHSLTLPQDQPTCQHCKQYGFECTFFLPITETRFKKKKLEEDAAEKERVDAPKPISAPHTENQTSVYGPTSAAHLLHSQASISSRIYETYDARYHHTFEVGKTGDGLIAVRRPNVDDAHHNHSKPVDLRIERETIEQLVNAYFTDVAPMLPVITKAEFLATPNPAPILLYSMCLVAAARRQVPQMVFDSIRYAVNNVIKSDDVLSTATIVNVQSLLILSMSGDCHSQFVPNALSALWIRLGTAIRMAQDLGLHRAESVKQDIELRRRLWGACLISDRWQVNLTSSCALSLNIPNRTSLAYGHPSMIDVQDCDARLPSSGDPNDLYMDELVRLSVILGRVLKTIYSPSGLTFTTDDMLYSLLGDIEAWKAGLPDHLKFRGPETPRTAAEIIALLYEATQGPHLPMETPPLNPTGGVTAKPPVSGLDYKKDPTRPGGGVFVAHGQAAREGDFKGVPAGVVISSAESGGSDLGEATPAPAVSSSLSVAPALNDRDRTSLLLSTSSSFAPPLPTDSAQNSNSNNNNNNAPPPLSLSNIPPMHRGLAMRSTVANQAGQQGLGSPTSPLVNYTPLMRRQGSMSNVNPAMNMQNQPQGNVQVMNVLDGPQGSNTLQEFALTDNGFLEGIPGSMFDWGQWDTFFSRFSGNGSGASPPVSNGMDQNSMAAFQQGQRPPPS